MRIAGVARSNLSWMTMNAILGECFWVENNMELTQAIFSCFGIPVGAA